MEKNTVYLEPNQVPAHLRGGYSGKHFKANICDRVTIPADAGLWSGGSRDTYTVIRLGDGARIEPVNHNAAPWDKRADLPVILEPGIAVVRHTYFCGKDHGLTFYLRAGDAAPLLPAPVAPLSEHAQIVLAATAGLKSSYNGRDRFQLAQEEHRWARDGKIRISSRSIDYSGTFPTREQWDSAKAELIALGLLNKAGAITTKGRNAT